MKRALAILQQPGVVGALALALFAAVLLPIVHAPFFGDDLTSSEINGYFRLSGESLWSVLVDTTRTSFDQGRPQVFIGLLGHPLFALLGEHPVLYHFYLLSWTIVDGALLYVLLRRMGWSAPAAALPIVFAAGFMQLRIYHDSLLSYGALLQILLALTLLSALFFLRWLHGGSRVNLFWAIGLYALCPMIYEVSYSFVAVHVGIALAERRGRAALRAAAPFLAIAGAFFVASFLLRQFAPASLEGYTVAGGPWTTLRTYFIQLFPPLPVTGIGFDPSIGGDATRAELAGAAWRALAVAAAVGALLVAVARRGAAAIAGSGTVVALGLALWLAPPLLLAPAPKYQVELGPGRGYLPVIVQVFGIAILTSAGLRALLVAAAKRSKVAVVSSIALAAGGAGVIAGVTAFANLRIVAMIQPEAQSRDLLEDAAGRGVFARMQSGSSLLFWDRDLSWIGPVPFRGYPYPPMMLAHKTGRAYDTRLEGAMQAEPGYDCPRQPGVVEPPCARLASGAAWVQVRVRRDGGTVIVAPFAPTGAPGHRSRSSTSELLVYRKAADGSPTPTVLTGATRRGRPWNSAGARWRELGTGDGWALYSVSLANGSRPTASSVDDPRAVIDFTAIPAPPQRVRLLGVKQILP